MSVGINIELKEKDLSNPNYIDLTYNLFPFGQENTLNRSRLFALTQIDALTEDIDFSDLREYILSSDDISQYEYNKTKGIKIQALEEKISSFYSQVESLIKEEFSKSLKNEEIQFFMESVDIEKLEEDLNQKINPILETLKSSYKDEKLYLDNIEKYLKSQKREIDFKIDFGNREIVKSMHVGEEIKARVKISFDLESSEIEYLDHKEIVFGKVHFAEYKKLLDAKVIGWIKKSLGESKEAVKVLRLSSFVKGVEFVLKEMTVENFITEYNDVNTLWNKHFEEDSLKIKILEKIPLFKRLRSLFYEDLNQIRKKIDDKLFDISDTFKKYDIEDISIDEIIRSCNDYNIKNFLNSDPEDEIESITSKILTSDQFTIKSKTLNFSTVQKMSPTIANKLKKSIIIQFSKDLKFNLEKQYNKRSILSDKEKNNAFITERNYTDEINVFKIENDIHNGTVDIFSKKLKKKIKESTHAMLFRDIEINGKVFNIDTVFSIERYLN